MFVSDTILFNFWFVGLGYLVPDVAASVAEPCGGTQNFGVFKSQARTVGSFCHFLKRLWVWFFGAVKLDFGVGSVAEGFVFTLPASAQEIGCFGFYFACVYPFKGYVGFAVTSDYYAVKWNAS